MTFTTMEQAFGLIGQWWLVSMLAFVAGTFLCWNHKWYRFLRDHTPLPEMRLLFIIITVMVTANSWSVWRLWRCENWDNDFAPLLVYLLMIVALHAYVPALMAVKSLWLCAAVSLVACGLAIAYATLAFVEADVYAGIVGVFDIVWALVHLGYTLYLNPLREEHLLNKYRGRPDSEPAVKHRRVSIHRDEDDDDDDEPLAPPPLIDPGTIPTTASTSGVQTSVRFSFP